MTARWSKRTLKRRNGGRKEEGLEQEFNSVHAQREACEAFIQSQASEEWKLIKTACNYVFQ